MKILIVGAGGYGQVYVQELLHRPRAGVTVEGIVDTRIDACPMKDEIAAKNIPVYTSMEAFYAEHEADLAVISTPTFLHCEQSVCALRHGSQVLCEKPAASLVDDAKRMMDAERTYDGFIGIGFQWAFHSGIQSLKQDVLDGKLGKPLSLKTFVSWPRTKTYYARGGGWGGRIRKDGYVILDSILSNACAHYMQNMLFVLGDTMDESAAVTQVEAACARVHTIENFDTCVLRCRTAQGAEVYFAATHAGDTNRDPEFVYTFENSVVEYRSDRDPEIVVTFADGTQKKYGDPTQNAEKKLWDAVACVREGTRPVCTVKTALPHTMLVNALYEHVNIADVPRDTVHEEDDRVYATGLYEMLVDAYEQGAMPDERGCAFMKTQPFTLGGNADVL